MATEVLRPYRSDWEKQARGLIELLRRRHLPYDEPTKLGCYPVRRLHLVRRSFHYKAKGRDVIVVVRLQPVAFVHLLQAMLDEPDIQAWGSLSSYRSRATQAILYERYLSGGPRAAPPCKSFHGVGLAFDGYRWSEHERRAMKRAGFQGLGAIDPPHYTYGQRG